MARTKKPTIRPTQSSGSVSKSKASSKSVSLQTPRPKCKLSSNFPAIRPKGCKIKAKQAAQSQSTSRSSHSINPRSTPHSYNSSFGSQATRARSESVVERRTLADRTRAMRTNENLLTYYAKKKKGKKATSGASHPQASQSSRA